MFMKKVFLLVLLCLLSLGTTMTSTSFAEVRDDVPIIDERSYFKVGYKSVGEALKECELLHHRDLRLPIKVPPVPFTLHLARCVNDKDHHNDELRIKYLNQVEGKYNYTIFVRPIEQKIDFGFKKIHFTKSMRLKKTYKLSDGSEAIYFTTKIPDLGLGDNNFVFENNEWQYRLSVDSRIENEVPVSLLIQVAESVRK
ncbi:hypothetical protein [Paenibacillus gansuensis]|uniref:Uncharacterized protein n=1 Tax=Paenibacillus gansuensis TaxID=306542 RepID=A0ABW5PHS5_9BACL